MNTVKRLILIESTLQQIPKYSGEINTEFVCLHSATQIIDTVSKM